MLKQQTRESLERKDSIKALTRLSALNGVSLHPALLDIDALTRCAKPIIVHMYGKSPETGKFILLLDIGNSNVDYLQPDSLIFGKMEIPSFRRNWSGIALIPKSDRWKNIIFYSFGLLLSLTFLNFIRRLRGPQAIDRAELK